MALGINVPTPGIVNCVTLSGLPSTSVSFVSTLPVAGVSSVTATVSSTATGRSLTGFTVMLALAAGDVAPLLSVTVNGILTVPLKLDAGINWMLAACVGVSAVLTGTAMGGVRGLPSLSYTNAPCNAVGSAVTLIAVIVPSGSLPVSGTAIDGASSKPVYAAALATGGTLLAPPLPLAK